VVPCNRQTPRGRESGGLELTSAHSHVYEAAASVQTPAPTFQRSAPNFHQPRGMAHRSGGTALMRIRRCLLRTWRRRSRECTSRGTRARWRRSALRVRTENSAQHVNGWHRARVSTARESLAPRKAQDQCFLRPQRRPAPQVPRFLRAAAARLCHRRRRR